MPRDPWLSETRDDQNPARPVVLRTTVLPIGDVLLALDGHWWRAASGLRRRELLVAHQAAIAAHLAKLRRIPLAAAGIGAVLGAVLTQVTEVPLLVVMPGTAVVGWLAANLGIARWLRTGLRGGRRSA